MSGEAVYTNSPQPSGWLWTVAETLLVGWLQCLRLPAAGWAGSSKHRHQRVLSLGPRELSWNVAKIHPVSESSAFPPAEESSRNREGPRMAAHREKGPDTEDGVTCGAQEGPSVGQQTPALRAPAPGDPTLGNPCPGGRFSPAGSPRPHLQCPRWRCCRSATASGRRRRPPC